MEKWVYNLYIMIQATDPTRARHPSTPLKDAGRKEEKKKRRETPSLPLTPIPVVKERQIYDYPDRFFFEEIYPAS